MESKAIARDQEHMDQLFETNRYDETPGNWKDMPDTEPPDDDEMNFDNTVEKAAIDRDAHAAATSPRNNLPEPSEKQKHAGNYQKGHINVGGIDIAIENPKGTRRRPNWETLKAHYGYIKLTTGADGDQIDCFVKEGTDDGWNAPVYVIDQYIDGKFDEHKVMIGFHSRQEATKAYLGSYQSGWKLGPVTRWSWKDFKEWVEERQHVDPVSGAN
jgi:Inorganic Pyrophosphatase